MHKRTRVMDNIFLEILKLVSVFGDGPCKHTLDEISRVTIELFFCRVMRKRINEGGCSRKGCRQPRKVALLLCNTIENVQICPDENLIIYLNQQQNPSFNFFKFLNAAFQLRTLCSRTHLATFGFT